MTGKAAWLLGAALMVSGVAVAKAQPPYDASAARDHGTPEDRSWEEDGSSAESASTVGSRADDDFSDIAGTGVPPLAKRDEEAAGASDAPQDRSAADGQDEESAMIDACAIAARDEAERDGGYAEVRRVEAPRESRSGYSIDGDVETRSGWRAQDGRLRHFTCTIAGGKIEDVYFARERAAR